MIERNILRLAQSRWRRNATTYRLPRCRRPWLKVVAGIGLTPLTRTKGASQ